MALMLPRQQLATAISACLGQSHCFMVETNSAHQAEGSRLYVQVRAQDIGTFVRTLAAAAGDPIAPRRSDLAWKYITSNLPTFEALFGGTQSDQRRSVDTMLAGVAQNFFSEQRLQDVRKFFSDRAAAPRNGTEGGAAGAALPQYAQEAVAVIQRRIWMARHMAQDACAWLRQLQSGTSPAP